MSDVMGILSRMMTAFDVSKYKDLAHKLGVSPNTIDVWKKREKIPEKNILKCVNLTGYPLEWIENGGELDQYINKNHTSEQKSDDSTLLKVSLLQAGAGEGIYNFEKQHKLLSLNVEYFPYLANESSIVAIEIVGESMEPVLKQGDYILITPPKRERATEDGIYAIRVDGMIKIKLLQFMLDGTIKIISYNKEFETEIYDPKNSQIDFAIIGKKRLVISR